MNWLYTTRRLALATLLLGTACPALAGEPIIVPGDKSKTAPVADPSGARSIRELFPVRSKANSMPLDVLSIPIVPDLTKPLDPKEEKRRRLQELERKNWMVVSQGELQAEEEEKNFLNVRDYSLDDLDKDKDSANLMFRPLPKDDHRRVPGTFRSASDKNRQPGERARIEGDSWTLGKEKDPKIGAHMSSELNMRQMFDPSQTGDSLAPKFNKSELTLHGLLNSGGGGELTREQQTQRDEFRNFLNHPRSASPFAGPSDPINLRGDATRQPLQPTLPQPFGGDTSMRASGNAFGTAPIISRPNSPLAASAPTFNRPAAPGFAAGQYLPPAPVKFEPPKRKF